MMKPLLICLTATRNYGWVINAFLKANSLWADYIIIADQHSTDGSREIALKYPKVILLDNVDLSYGETARSQMVIDRARQIEGDKILFYLAIDEVLAANYNETEDWAKIINSVPGDVFFFQWANLCPDKKNYWVSNTSDNKPFYMARMFHDDEVTPYDNEGLDMHTHCIPYPKEVENHLFRVNDFKILHFGEFSEKWNLAKQRFYHFVDFDKNNRNITSLSRMYNRWTIERQCLSIPEEWIHRKDLQGFDLFNEVNSDEQPFLDNYVLEFIKKNGIERYRKLDVWDKSFLSRYSIIDPRPFWIRIIHFYFHFTARYTHSIFIRAIDKLLKISAI
jgi:hypothetical protein